MAGTHLRCGAVAKLTALGIHPVGPDFRFFGTTGPFKRSRQSVSLVTVPQSVAVDPGRKCFGGTSSGADGVFGADEGVLGRTNKSWETCELSKFSALASRKHALKGDFGSPCHFFGSFWICNLSIVWYKHGRAD